MAKAISEFTSVTMLTSYEQYQNCRAHLPENIKVIEMSSNDAWCRDVGPTFLVNDQGEKRACDWKFNAWGGLVDGLYFPWDADDQIAGKICELEGIDLEETNGHIDDVACFVRPGEVACIYTEDTEHPFYEQAQAAYKFLSEATDARGRKLKVHKVCLTKKPVLLDGAETIDRVQGTIPRKNGELCIASYLNFLITNGGIIAPQYEDEHDALALSQLQEIFPGHKVVGVKTREIVYGGGNIHCITQQQPR